MSARPEPAAGSVRVAAVVEYDGRPFAGWQRQAHSLSVQETVEDALSFVADQPVAVVCAGRTDTGVHATHQVIHFDTTARREAHQWLKGTNSRLPATVRLLWAGEVAGDFHARYAALSRTYRYLILNRPVAPAVGAGLITWVREPLDVGAMRQASRALLGERDFSAFRASGCQSKSPYRRVDAVEVWRAGPLVVLEVTANAFLHHMVRNIAGALIAVGRGQRPPAWLEELLAGRDRRRGAPTAPADGLYLVGVAYPERFGIPRLPPGPFLLGAAGEGALVESPGGGRAAW
ncbi:MAG: tRNA pseudouridine synthase A [Porticoccaceae bacterium]|nr:MAG: tRNA pseudouridine synthase A [Porticoccaceae bacterium]